MKLRKDLNLYVIGLRRYAEVRVGKKPPIPHTTSFSKTIPVTKLVRLTDGIWGEARYKTTTVDKTVVFKQTTWAGGRVLGPISTNSLGNLHIFVTRDTVKQVPDKFVKGILDHLESHHA